MTAIIMKILSAMMSIVVFLSGAFPALFGGKEYIDHNGDKVTVVDGVDIGDDALVIKDYESYKALGDIGVSYDEEFFKTNNLAVFTKEYHVEDDFYLISVCVTDGRNMDVKYYIEDNSLAAWYSPAYKTVLVETSKDISSLRPVNSEHISFIKLYRSFFEK